MRSRKWVLVVSVFASIVILFIYYGWQFSRANDRIKNYVLTELQPTLTADFEIDRVRVGLGVVHFKGVSLTSGDQRFSFYIHDLRLGYNPVRLLFYGFDPKRISEDILLIKPRLIIQQLPETTIEDNNTLINSSVKNRSIPENGKGLEIFGYFEHLSVSEGEIIIKDTSGVETRAAHSINGWLSKTDQKLVDLNLGGSLFNSKETNLIIEGRLNPSLGTVDFINLRLHEYEPDSELPPFLPPFIKNVHGRVDGELSLTTPDSLNGRFDLNGRLSLKDGSMLLTERKLLLNDLSWTATVNHWNLKIDEGRCSVNSSKVELDGEIRNLLNPEFDLKLQSDSLSLEHFTSVLFEKSNENLAGTAFIKIFIQGPYTNTQVDGEFYCSRVKYKEQKFNNLTVKAAYQHPKLKFSEITGNFLNHQIDIKSQIDYSDEEPLISGSVNVIGNLTPIISSFATDSIVSCNDWMRANIHGSLSEPVVDGEVGFSLLNTTNDSIYYTAAFNYLDESLTFSPPSNNGELELRGWIKNPGSNPTFSLSLKNAHHLVRALIDIPWEEKWSHNIELNLQAVGNLKKHQLSSYMNWKPFGKPKFSLLDIQAERSVKKNGATWKGHMAIYPDSDRRMEGEFILDQQGRSVSLERFRIDDSINAWFTAEATQSNQQQLTGAITFDDIELNRFFAASDSTCFGSMSAEVKIDGTPESPKLKGFARFYDIFCNQCGPFTCEAEFGYADSTLMLEKLHLNKNLTTILFAEGGFWTKQDSTHLVVKGAGFDASIVSTALTGKSDRIKGESLIDVELDGSPYNPRLKGIIAIKNGAIGKLRFDKLSVQIDADNYDFLAAGMSQTPPIGICMFDLIRDDQFTIHGSGQVPLSTKAPLHFQLKGEGNLLAILLDINSYFRKAQSDGKLFVDISGTLNDFVVDSAKYVFKDASLEFSSIVPKVTKLSGDVRFHSEGSYVQIVDLYGNMDGEPFRIFNVPESPRACSRQLEPFKASDLGINFGVFAIETTKRGVPLNFPGLMERDDFGRFVFLGREHGEKFYFSGPIERPVLRGKTSLENVNFMYPFQKHAAVKFGSGVKSFLRNIDWDLRVVPGTDTRYVKELPGAVDDVYINLQLDEGYGGLDFTGRLDDRSFRIEGEVRSNRGLIEYIDMNFRLDQAGVLFDKGMLQPVVYGRARSTVVDSVGQASQVYLTLETVDRTLKNNPNAELVKQEVDRARWKDIRFKLSTDNPNFGTTEGHILAVLGYSGENIQEKAVNAIGIRTDNLLFRPLFRPFERRLERSFGLDYVRFSSHLARNFITFNLSSNEELNSKLMLLQSTRLVVGKYLANRFFLLYTGQLEAGMEYRYQKNELGLHHTFGLEYQVSPNVLLQMEYDYNSLHMLDRDDKRILLRHWFPF